MGIEYELKFRGTPAVQNRIRESFPQEETVYQMETAYYDTPSGALSERYYTLRKRMENGTPVCTLKTPEKGRGRGEWEVPCDSIEKAIPELCKLGAPEDLLTLTAEGVNVICGARFIRIAKTIRENDCVLELALDEGVLTGGDQTVPLCEVEVELKEGSREAADLFACVLAHRFGLTPEKGSKFRRALALYKGE